MEATSLRFAAAARVLGRVARRRGLDVPGFRSPPRLQGADRSLRRHESGTVTISVRYRERPWAAVLADMIDGVVAANRLVGNDADRARAALWAAVETEAAMARPAPPRAGGAHPRASGAVRPAPGRPELVGDDDGGGVPARRFPARLPGASPAARAPRPGPARSRPPLRAVPTRHVA